MPHYETSALHARNKLSKCPHTLTPSRLLRRAFQRLHCLLARVKMCRSSPPIMYQYSPVAVPPTLLLLPPSVTPSLTPSPPPPARQALVGILRLSTLPLRHWPRYLTLTVLPPVAAVVGASFCLDSWIYGTATLVPLNFLRFNVLEGKSRIFGEQAWHWNFSQGLPAVLGAALPAALWGFWRPLGGGQGLSGCGGGGGGGDRRLGWLAMWFLGETVLRARIGVGVGV